MHREHLEHFEMREIWLQFFCRGLGTRGNHHLCSAPCAFCRNLFEQTFLDRLYMNNKSFRAGGEPWLNVSFRVLNHKMHLRRERRPHVRPLGGISPRLVECERAIRYIKM